ncbi:hypothetical protein [Bacillus piscicola]|uniref:hypothetical protein n=1 Tax=Bacillus piscicola TaxID=1632684 RepID=UPI001F094FD6|nr:hypothetical protein [Bacillus piscicola]
MEIGSEFWLSNIAEEANGDLPLWLSEYKNLVLTSSARGAISLLLQQVNPQKKTVLLPEYICESVILPFVEAGYKCYFYEINEDLSPNIESIKSFNTVGVFLHLGYYGFQTNCNLNDVIRHLKSQSTIIVEDITHTLFSSFNRYQSNDYFIASVRKWFGIPSGGFIASNKKQIKYNLSLNKPFIDLRTKGLITKGNYMKDINKAENAKSQFLAQFTEAEGMLDKDVKPYSIDILSKKLISSLEKDELVKKRKENFGILLKGLSEKDEITTLFKALPKDVCPIFKPILIKGDRDLVRKKLISNKIYCPIHWPIPNVVRKDNFKNTLGIYNTILSIPCDQRYGEEDMKRIVSVIQDL